MFLRHSRVSKDQRNILGKQEILNGEYVNRFDPNNMYSGSYHPGMQITRRNTIGAPQQDQHHPHVVDDNGQSHHNAVVDNLSYFA